MDVKQNSPSAESQVGAGRMGEQIPPVLWGTVALLVLLLIAGLALLVGLQADHQPATVTIGEPQAGGQVSLQVGDVLQVNLDGNPSTGYSWSAKGLDATVLEQAGEPEFRPASSALGASGTVTARFVAVGAGQTTLTLSYARPFERGVPPLKTFTVSVLVTTPYNQEAKARSQERDF
jgi:predicted secreted protein